MTSKKKNIRSNNRNRGGKEERKYYLDIFTIYRIELLDLPSQSNIPDKLDNKDIEEIYKNFLSKK